VSAVREVSAGTSHTCAVHADGTVSCWGHGAFIAPGLPAVTGPVKVPLPGPAGGGLAVGIQGACAVHQGGLVGCWGDFGRGPQPPADVTTEGGPKLAGASLLIGGSVAFCAVDAAGTWCWGENKASELARPASASFPPLTAVLSHAGRPVLAAATVAMLVHDGVDQLCGWGNNDSGLFPGARGIVDQPRCGPLADVHALTAGDGHACALRGGDRFSCWGQNSGGQLGSGDDSALEADLPGTAVTLPGEIAGIAAGAYHTCALLKTGAAYCWGNNDHGEVGQPPSSAHFDPTPVAGGDRFVAIASGAGATHTCGILADGSVRCWGYDDRGQLGSGATREDSDRWSAAPVPVRW
jgi:alpha-tubulin suppressor-like RCC1 family protein